MTHGTWQIDQLWYNTSILRYRIFYCKKTKNGNWVHKRVRVQKFEYINEYGSPYSYPYSFMYSNFRTRTRLCTQSWPNIGDSYVILCVKYSSIPNSTSVQCCSEVKKVNSDWVTCFITLAMLILKRLLRHIITTSFLTLTPSLQF